MATGTVKSFDVDRGFGFLAVEGGKDVFFHQSAITGDARQITVGTRVEFKVEESPKGPRASDVRVVASG